MLAMVCATARDERRIEQASRIATPSISIFHRSVGTPAIDAARAEAFR